MKSEKNPHLAELRKRVGSVPTGPGVYRWMSEKGEVLYVGKAKNLRERMRSYLPAEARSAKAGVVAKADASAGPWKLSLREKIADFDVTTTSNEVEALVLETNLIKNLRPKYNVLMKDDKNYVYVRISLQEKYPSVSILRRIEDDGATYFGPFFTSYKTEQILKNLDLVWRFKACKKSLERCNGAHRKVPGTFPPAAPPGCLAPCLEYQIGRCNGLCIGAISEEEHRRRMENVVRFFRGDHTEAKHSLEEAMQEAVTEQKFEAAARLRDALLFIEVLQEKQIVSDTSEENADAIGIALRGGRAQVVLLRERDGKVIDELSYMLTGEASSPAEALAQFLQQYYGDTPDIPEQILVSEELPERGVLEQWLREKRGKRVTIITPERGKKSKLLTMAERNASEKIEQQYAKWEAAAKNTESALRELQDALALPESPHRIEGYDISHLGGTETVGAMVVFTNGKSANAEYRSFTLRTVKEGEIDDYKALGEVLRRRLRYLVGEKSAAANITTLKKPERAAWRSEHASTLHTPKGWREEIAHVTFDGKCIVTLDLRRSSKEKKKIFGSVAIHTAERNTLHAALETVERVYGSAELALLVLADAPLDVFSLHGFMEATKGWKVFPAALLGPPKGSGPLPPTSPPKGPDPIPLHRQKTSVDASLKSTPDLLLVDGGIGQLNVVANVLGELRLSIPVITLAKKEETVYAQNGIVPLNKNSQAGFLLQRIRDEAHRRCHEHREKRAIKALRSASYPLSSDTA